MVVNFDVSCHIPCRIWVIDVEEVWERTCQQSVCKIVKVGKSYGTRSPISFGFQLQTTNGTDACTQEVMNRAIYKRAAPASLRYSKTRGTLERNGAYSA